MRESETFDYIRRKYPDKEEKWRKVTQLVKFDEDLEVKSVHDFNINCYISTFGRLIRNGILCNMAYGDSFDDVLEEAQQSGLVIVTGASDDLMEFDGAIRDEGGCFDGGRVYFDKDGVDQEGEKRANWIDARWCDGMNRDGLPADWTYETEIPCERFDIWEDGEVYCVGLVFSIEDLK